MAWPWLVFLSLPMVRWSEDCRGIQHQQPTAGTIIGVATYLCSHHLIWQSKPRSIATCNGSGVVAVGCVGDPGCIWRQPPLAKLPSAQCDGSRDGVWFQPSSGRRAEPRLSGWIELPRPADPSFSPLPRADGRRSAHHAGVGWAATGDGPTNRLPHPRGQVFGHICVPFIRPIEREICLLTSAS